MRRVVAFVLLVGSVGVACSSSGLVDGGSSGGDAGVTPGVDASSPPVGDDATVTPPGVDATADSTSSDGSTPSDASDAATEAASDASSDAAVCPYNPDPTSAACPAECTGGCAGGVCNIDCSGTTPETKCGDHNWFDFSTPQKFDRRYVGPAVRCPDGMPCKITCGPSGCRGKATTGMLFREPQAVFRCPSDASCEIDCTASKAGAALTGCFAFNVQCGNDHPCTTNCGPDGCQNYVYTHCGNGRCEVVDGANTWGTNKIECGPSCQCLYQPIGLHTGGVETIPCDALLGEGPCIPPWTPWP
jgi:hypothetical protein